MEGQHEGRKGVSKEKTKNGPVDLEIGIIGAL